MSKAFDQPPQCDGKVRFSSAKMAHEVVAKRNAMGNRGVRGAYRCAHCGGWHIGQRFMAAVHAKRDAAWCA